GIAINPVTRQPNSAFQTIKSLTAFTFEKSGRRREHRCIGQGGIPAYGKATWHTISPLEISAVTVAIEQFARERLRHHSRFGIAINGEAQKRTPDRQAGNEGTGSVNGIDDPDITAVDIL